MNKQKLNPVSINQSYQKVRIIDFIFYFFYFEEKIGKKNTEEYLNIKRFI